MPPLTKDEMLAEIKKLKAEIKLLKEAQELAADLPSEAIDIIRDGRKFKKVIIKYNIQTGSAKLEKVEHLADNKTSAHQKADMMTGRLFLKLDRE